MAMGNKTKRRYWTEREIEILKVNYHKRSAGEISEQLGRTRRQVYNKALSLGLCIPQRFKKDVVQAFLMEKHADGWTDAEIARILRVERHAVSRLRKRSGLPHNAYSQHRRDQVRLKTEQQLRDAGLSSLAELRAKSFRERARRSGWPENLRPRAVQILNLLWDHGPQTRRQIAKAIGMPWRGSRRSLKSNDPEGSYLAHLMKRGMVIYLGRIAKGKGRGGSCGVYSLPLWIERKNCG